MIQPSAQGPARPETPKVRLILAMVPTVLVAACATYHAKPLPDGADLANAPSLELPAGQLAVPGLSTHPFNPANGLDMTETVTLAVLNNPDLKAKRLQAGVAAAQLLQAGLLPNPQLSTSYLNPVSGQPPLSDSYTFGLMQDLTALISRGAARAAARADKAKVNLNILWQEWQVAQKARQLFIQARAHAHLDDVLETRRRLYAKRYRRDRKALRQGNLTLATSSADLVALVDANTQLRQLQRQRNQTRHALDALLGLKPEVKPRLTGFARLHPFSRAQFRTALAQLPRRRPDLLALKAGYHSQEATVRKAILQQFPTLSIGPTGGRDTGFVNSVGFSINLTLPLFDHNQGRIAIARATRAVLRQTYQARLDSAVNAAHKLWREVHIRHRQLRQLEARLPKLEATTDAAQRSFARGNLSAGTYINLRSSLLAKRVEAIRLKSALQQAQAGLETLLGMTLGPRGSTAGGES
ncbi:TolC family protein [Salinisphaera sp.]|uniref:TolC family protein n=1 Tax=Salinisphaera sp. TaxID=1914330 RepID=UPI002D78BCA0|nr:TolC family protein [Salinisphaera sp.]HET7313463.1 TolC family protein [Salinisphaera sp.]